MSSVKQFDVFLSHNSDDKPWVIRLKDDLERNGVKVWLDKDEIRPGDLFAEALERGIEESKAVALIISPEAMASGWVRAEYYRALSLATNKMLQLIPVLHKNAQMPGFLGVRKYVDFSDENSYLEHLENLIWGITGEKPAGTVLHKEVPALKTEADKGPQTPAVLKLENPIVTLDDESLQEFFNRYYGEFHTKSDYLSRFEKVINQSASNTGILITASEELTGLAALSRKFLSELTELGLTLEYPENDLERNDELASSMASQAYSGAGLVATNQNASLHINQIERNLPLLQNIVQQLLGWLQSSASPDRH